MGWFNHQLDNEWGFSGDDFVADPTKADEDDTEVPAPWVTAR